MVTELKDTNLEALETVVIRFAGDSGDGMQMVGELFTDNSALLGNDLSTFPDFPSEIRAPAGSIPGVSGFQIQFGSVDVLTPGDELDALVAMNPAAFKVNVKDLKQKGFLVVNASAFNEKNLKKAGFEENPLDDPLLAEKYALVSMNMEEITSSTLEDSELKATERKRSKNFFALGVISWIYDRNVQGIVEWIGRKWAKRPAIADANIRVLKAGYNTAETFELIQNQYSIGKAPHEAGTYRKIMGNEASALGMVAAAHKAGMKLVQGSYPITPATGILEHLAKLKSFGVKTVQAEDEIAGIGVALGASYAGALGLTTTSGPGLALKTEFMGLAVISELPLVIINVQRGGPSTGLPTKTEQSDLLQSMWGRNGDCPMPVIAAQSPGDCFYASYEAAAIAVKYNTPVLVLTDGFLANSSEPWKVPKSAELPAIERKLAKPNDSDYRAYRRDPETLSRTMAIPGQEGLEHRLGGLEKDEMGAVSHDGENHQVMSEFRRDKIEKIEQDIPNVKVKGSEKGKLLVVGWGGTYGQIETAVRKVQAEGRDVSSIHLRNLNPFPPNLGEVLGNFEKVLVPELNLGQLVVLLRNRYLLEVEPFNVIKGRMFHAEEVYDKILEML